MNEAVNEAVNESPEEHPAVPEAAEPEAPARARRPVGRIVAVALLALAVVGGVGFTAVAVAGADRDAGKPVYTFPKVAAVNRGGQNFQEEQQGKDVSGLRGMLMPYQESGASGYVPGPDIGEFGPDVVLSGREATALRKQEIRDLPSETRAALNRVIDKEHIQGMAMRSYAPYDKYEGLTKPFTLTVEMVRMANRDSVRDLSAGRNEFLKALRIFPKGPEIKGHKEAACFRMPKLGGEEIDRMVCSASVGDVLVTVNAAGPRPLGTDAIAVFVGSQLDRIKDKDPGKAV
ncbi:hypothetical protein ABB07_20450 [Streptomyces incarnatus]|uniref:Secreted protein n=1 Tax=Streptomyces incarnatus TaxID=665007 RepID=A0ABN4GHK0_9ACTN|nr:hypothetical protein [Streptomyces incarnatus]AKJ12312.1 hypothetical protein ABB07_20450 [Streptomyces incarnatus]